MAKIKKLPFLEARKIAAGEVIEGPVNVVKELLENSLDSGADQVSIYIRSGGSSLIRILDNGCGMSSEDAEMAFELHATSKITKVDDLESLHTFGFRGEALSSICSVSKVTLISRDEDSNLATKLFVEDSEIKHKETVSANVGTDIIVENLFYNVPARLKFLKKEETEWRKILNVFLGYCFSYKNVHFKLFNNDSLVYNCPPVDNLSGRVAQLWDSSIASSMLDVVVDNKNPEYSVHGLITNHQISFFNRSKIFLFINNRYVKSNDITKSILKGYSNVLPSGKFPSAIIFIETDPKNLDVNIHPKKEEVKILFESNVQKTIQSLVAESIKKSFSSQISKSNLVSSAKSLDMVASAPLFSLDSKQIKEKTDAMAGFKPAMLTDGFDSDLSLSRELRNNYIFENSDLVNDFDRLMAFENEAVDIRSGAVSSFEPIVEEVVENIVEFIEFDIIGQFSKTYILLENSEGLLYVDQHAAHEAILYEAFLNNFKDIPTVRLLFPQVISLNDSEMSSLGQYFELLLKFGIEIEKFGPNEIVIISTPVHLKDLSLRDFIFEILSWIEEDSEIEKADCDVVLSKKLCAQMACKAAVKAGDILNIEQMNQLISDLYNLENRFTCPHGRPTLWTMPLAEIEKKFKRRN